jgi:hypothetical protein
VTPAHGVALMEILVGGYESAEQGGLQVRLTD